MTALIVILGVVSIGQLLVLAFVSRLFIRGTRELEELALIESKERREYLAQASDRMKIQNLAMRKDLEHTPAEQEDAFVHGNRRMREAI